jgi:hypothetical protein
MFTSLPELQQFAPLEHVLLNRPTSLPEKDINFRVGICTSIRTDRVTGEA